MAAELLEFNFHEALNDSCSKHKSFFIKFSQIFEAINYYQ